MQDSKSTTVCTLESIEWNHSQEFFAQPAPEQLLNSMTGAKMVYKVGTKSRIPPYYIVSVTLTQEHHCDKVLKLDVHCNAL